MGTSAKVVLKYNGEEKSTYIHYDGYVEGYGRKLQEFICRDGIANLKRNFHLIKMVDEGKRPTRKEIEALMFDLNLELAHALNLSENVSWYTIMRAHQGDLRLYMSGYMSHEIPMCDGSAYRTNYTYILDLDNNVANYNGVSIPFREFYRLNDFYDSFAVDIYKKEKNSR